MYEYVNIMRVVMYAYTHKPDFMHVISYVKKKKTCYIIIIFVIFYIQFKMNIPEIFFMKIQRCKKSSCTLLGSFSSPLSYVVNSLDGEVGNTVTAGTNCLRWS